MSLEVILLIFTIFAAPREVVSEVPSRVYKGLELLFGEKNVNFNLESLNLCAV